MTFRQRNLYCRFDLGGLPAGELERLEAKAAGLGDYVLAGHLLRNVDAYWDTHVLKRCTSRCGVTACGLGRAYHIRLDLWGGGSPSRDTDDGGIRAANKTVLARRADADSTEVRQEGATTPGRFCWRL